MNSPWEWTEADLLELIRAGTQESIELDYKRCGSLDNTDGKKNEVSKDVSACANSAGGTLVYGMIEDGHVATDIDRGFDPSDITKEWLEQVINSRIQRRIDGIRINQIPLSGSKAGRVAYVVYVPQSMRAPHQAADKKFYRRFNFASVPMEEYEVRDVARRADAPDLEIRFSFKDGSVCKCISNGGNRPVQIQAVVENKSAAPAQNALFTIYVDDRIGASVEYDQVLAVRRGGVEYRARRMRIPWHASQMLPLWEGIVLPVADDFEVSLAPSISELIRTDFVLAWEARSPGMACKAGSALLSYVAGEMTLQHDSTPPEITDRSTRQGGR